MAVFYTLQVFLLLVYCCTGETAELSSFSNCFTLNLYKELAKSNQNLISSPFSADVLLSLLLTASGGNTATQLNKALSYDDNTDFTISDIKNAFHNTLNSIVGSDGNVLTVADSIWIQNSFHVNSDFFQTSRDYFNAYVDNSMEFRGNPKNATDTINNWAAKNTNGLIPKIFDEVLPKNTLMVLANALYFKGHWAKKFDIQNTFNQPFFSNGDDSQSNSVPLMNQLQNFSYQFSEEMNAQMLEMEYSGGEISMYILLPDESSNLKIFEENLDCKKLENSYSNLINTIVQVSLPKFSINSDLDLKGYLKALGIVDLFDTNGGANLSGLGSVPNLAVGEVVQKAYIQVDETGSEAAAVTAARVCRACSAVFEDHTTFRADRPFLYFIRHKPTGLILFIGRVTSL